MVVVIGLGLIFALMAFAALPLLIAWIAQVLKRRWTGRR